MKICSFALHTNTNTQASCSALYCRHQHITHLTSQWFAHASLKYCGIPDSENETSSS